jgi:dimethylglycine catabolism B
VNRPTSDAAGPEVEAIADAALHGSYCPKMCTFACPVTSATGRDDAVPWNFHRTVSDLATGRLPVVAAVADRLTACSGCLACREPCVFDQDVPAQVRAGRAAAVAAGVAPAAVTAVVDAVARGTSPTGHDLPLAPPPDPAATTVLVAGCRDDASAVRGTLALLRAAAERVAVVVPDGCCGALLDDLGATAAATTARETLADRLPPAATVVALDPHCLPSLRSSGVEATDLASHLATALDDGRLHLEGATWPATWHDPCVLARGEGVTEAPRRLLAAAGADLLEAERWGSTTGCSGAGLGLDLLDPQAADATAAARTVELGDRPVVTGCARAAERLRAAGADVTDLAAALLARLDPAHDTALHDPSDGSLS